MPFDTNVLTYGEALKLIGGLSAPSKMPWWGWSISAHECNTGGKLRKIENSVCSKCYALRGNYVFENVKNAHARRLEGLYNPLFVSAFVTVLTKLYKGEGAENRFRWHDAGDLQGIWHLHKIFEIAERLPQIRFYLPTKEKGILNRNKRPIPANLFIKLSSPMIGSIALHEKFDVTTAGYDGPEVKHCPAAQQDNKCGSCDSCWLPGNINYKVH